MLDEIFPPEVPKVGDLLRVTPTPVDYVPRNYKFFCEEAHVISRFTGKSYDGTNFCIEVFLGGRYLNRLFYNQTYKTWSVNFDDQTINVEVEVILE